MSLRKKKLICSCRLKCLREFSEVSFKIGFNNDMRSPTKLNLVKINPSKSDCTYF